MIEYMKLELHKNRLLFIGIAITFLLSLPFTILMSALNHYPVGSSLNAAFFFWTLAGLPLIAVLFGSSGGSALRIEPTHGAEAPLPLSPRQKASGAVLAAGVHLALLTLLVLLVSFILSPAWREALLGRAALFNPFFGFQKDANPFLRLLFALTAFTMGYILLVSFTCAYAMRQGILGGFLGAVLGGLAAIALTCGFALQSVFEFRAPFSGLAFLIIVVSLLGSAAGLDKTASWVERHSKVSWAKGLAIIFGLALGSISSICILSATYHRLLQSLYQMNGSWPGGQFDPWFGLHPNMPNVHAATDRGVLLQSLGGDLVWITPNAQRTTLIAGENRPFKDILDFPLWSRIISTLWGEDGSLWVLVEGNRHVGISSFQLWHGTPGNQFILHTKISSPYYLQGLVRRGRELGFSAWGKESIQYAAIPSAGQQPRWVSMGKDVNAFLLDAWFEEGKAARLSQDRHAIVQKLPGGGTRRWTLPGKAEIPGVNRRLFPLVSLAGRGSFLVPVGLNDRSKALAVCDQDGTVRLQWQGISTNWFETGTNGAIWTLKDKTTLYAATSNGKFLSLNLKPILGVPEIQAPSNNLSILRLDNSKVWVIVQGNTLVEAELQTGRLLQKWTLPDTSAMLKAGEQFTHVVTDGFFLHTGRSLYFIRWDGTQRYLGKA